MRQASLPASFFSGCLLSTFQKTKYCVGALVLQVHMFFLIVCFDSLSWPMAEGSSALDTSSGR